MSWQINIPHRDLDEPAHALLGHVRDLPEPERDVTRELILLQLERGARSAGDVISAVAGSDPAGRRALLDTARTRAGLEKTAEVDARERVRRDSYSALDRSARDPRPLRLGYSASGAVADLNEREDEARRAEQEERSRRARREAAEQERRAEAAERDAYERAWDDRLARETPPGMNVP